MFKAEACSVSELFIFDFLVFFIIVSLSSYIKRIYVILGNCHKVLNMNLVCFTLQMLYV